MDCRRLAIVLQALVAIGCNAPRVILPPAGEARLVVFGDAVLQASTAAGGPRADVGGISGAYYDTKNGILYAVSDDRQRPRLLTFTVQVTPHVSLVPGKVVALKFPYGQRRTLDAEGLAGGSRGRFFVSSEGDAANPTEPVPGIYEYRSDGGFVRSLPMPSPYVRSSKGSGMRANGALEGLSASPTGGHLFAATESSLRQDSDEATFEHGALIRILSYKLGSLATRPREYAYRTDPLQRPSDLSAPRGETGVSEILSLGDTDLLVLERGFVRETAAGQPRTANTIRIYRTQLNEAAEVTGRTSLREQPPAAVLKKTLVLDLVNITPDLSERLRGLENFEAMSFGPRLPDGGATLLLLSDDNFSNRQVTALLVLRWSLAQK